MDSGIDFSCCGYNFSIFQVENTALLQRVTIESKNYGEQQRTISNKSYGRSKGLS